MSDYGILLPTSFFLLLALLPILRPNSYFHTMRFPSIRPRVLFSALAATTFASLMLSASDAGAAGRRPALVKEPTTKVAEAPTPRSFRAYQSDWLEALREYRRGDFRDAASALQKLEGGDPLSDLYRTVVMAQAYWRARDTVRADAALTAALASPAAKEPVWQRHLHRLKMRLAASHTPAGHKAYLLSVLRAPVDDIAKTEAYYRLLALDTVVAPRAERVAWAKKLIAIASPGSRLEREYERWTAAMAPTDTTRESQRFLLDWEEKLGLWDAAIARATALTTGDTSPEAVKPLALKMAQWHYNAGRYEQSIQEYLRSRERFGDSPEVLIQLARAYRALSQDAPSQSWYTRLVERYPKDARTAETLWMRAFDDEMTGKIDTAIGGYARIARDFPQHTRSGEAMFRLGLVQYRRGNYGAAHKAFSDLRLASKTGRLTGAAHYWEGKALAGRGQDSAARDTWAALTRDYPFGHYGHLARAELVKRNALVDSLRWNRMLNSASGDSLKSWFVALRGVPLMPTVQPVLTPAPDTSGPTSPAALTSADEFAARFGESAWMPVDNLFGLGLDTLAVLTLQARAASAPANLWLVYDAALRCRKAGFGYEAYRFAVRLSDKLPVAQWPSAPVDVLRLFYPPSYIELVRPHAQQAGIPAGLVLALIKQESGFEPSAVSRVGARGLMQLMPTTGTEQARKESLKPFHPDSLFSPGVNIQLGVAYLRDVLRKHDGNIDYALAHYNAGPTALARWIPRLENRPPEDAVEDIGYAETREYVKRVGSNYKTYQVLWEGTGK